MKNKKILFSALAITYVALLSSCEGEMPSANTNVIASTTTIEDTKTTALDENSSTSTTNDSIISSTTEDTPTTENLKPELVVGGQYFFGSYPQTKVEASIENGLASIEFNSSTWIDYGYYVADEIQSYMYYYDVDINNDSVYDYRGVYFTSYRPSEVSLQNYEYNSDQMYMVILVIEFIGLNMNQLAGLY